MENLYLISTTDKITISQKINELKEKNKDAEIIQGTNEIKEVPYKVFCDIEPIGKKDFTKSQYNLIANYYALRKQNDDMIESIINSLQDLKIELNSSTQKALIKNLNKPDEEMGE